MADIKSKRKFRDERLTGSLTDGSADYEAKGGYIRRFYLPELDALRFFAFLSVFVFHAIPHDLSELARHPIPVRLKPFVADALAAGGFGVDLFFVLSAYLITELLLRERSVTGAVDVGSFYARRILRIWPLYFAFLGFASILSVAFSEVSEFRIRWYAVAAYVLLVGNIGSSFWGVGRSIIAPLWSISLEEQFYLFWPPVLRSANERKLAGIGVGLLIVSSVCRYALVTRRSPDFLGMFTLTRLDPMGLGILLAVALGGRKPNLSIASRLTLIAAGMVGWFACTSIFEFGSSTITIGQTMVGFPLAAVSSAAFLVATIGAPEAGIRIAANPILVYLGKISYGLYVYHVFALTIVRFAKPHFSAWSWDLINAPASFVLTVVISAVSYHWLESPFLRLKDQFARVKSRPI